MATTSATSSRLHPALQEGLSNGSVARMKVGDRYYLVYNVKDGALTRSAFSPTANVEKIRQVAQLALDTQKAAGKGNPALEGKEITHMTNLGASFEGNPIPFSHSSAKVTSAEDYLRATNDLAWQAPVLALSEKLNGLTDPVATLPATELPPEFRAYLHRQGVVQTTYPVHSDATTKGLKEHLLDFTREKIKHTQAVYGQVQTGVTEKEYQETIHGWVVRFPTVEEAIEGSNGLIRSHFTAQHIWQTLINLTNDTSPEIYREPPPVIPSDEEDESRASSPASSRRSSMSGPVHRPPPVVVAEDLDRPSPSSPRGRPEDLRGRGRSRSLSLPPQGFHEEERGRALTPPPRRPPEDHGEDVRERGRSRSRSVSPSSSRSLSRSPSRERSLSPAPTRRQPHRDGPLQRVPVEHGEDPLTAVESGSRRTATRIPFRAPIDEASRRQLQFREAVSLASRPRKQYMSIEDSRLTRAYRELLPQINGPILEGPKDFRGAYGKFQRFKEDHEREDLEPLSQAELLAVREAHQKVMEVPDYKRHADLQDARYFDAILYELKIKR